VEARVEGLGGSRRAPRSGVDLLVGEAVTGTQEPHSAGRDGADPVLGLPRMTDLPHGERLERNAEGAGDLRRHLDSSAREAHDDHPARRRLDTRLLEGGSEQATSLAAIGEAGPLERMTGHRLHTIRVAHAGCLRIG
jgi:hypothetical protein